MENLEYPEDTVLMSSTILFVIGLGDFEYIDVQNFR